MKEYRPDEEVTVNFTKPELDLLRELLDQAPHWIVRSVIDKIDARSGATVTLSALEWNTVLAVLDNGIHKLVRPLWDKIVAQATGDLTATNFLPQNHQDGGEWRAPPPA